MLHKLIKGLAPIAAIALGAGLAGCNGARVHIGDSDGVPLSELDLTGEAPTGLVLAGPDTVLLEEGETLAIDVSGDPAAVDALRFTLAEGSLGIMRRSESGRSDGKAEVRVTMPAPETIVVAGSGTVEAGRLAPGASVTIAGSGKARAPAVEGQSLEVTIAGSGAFEAAGNVERLDLTIAGSGSARMAALKAEEAKITIAGSGDAGFASDGTVDAKIIGSGDVRITGTAKCTVNSLGSGTVTCQSGPATAGRDTSRADAKAAKKAAKTEKTRTARRKSRKGGGPELA